MKAIDLVQDRINLNLPIDNEDIEAFETIFSRQDLEKFTFRTTEQRDEITQLFSQLRLTGPKNAY